MRSHTGLVFAVCLSLIAVAGAGSADIIIDENFDAPPTINIPMAPNEVLVTAAMSNMWFGGAPSFSMAWGILGSMSMGMGPMDLFAFSRAGMVPPTMGMFMGWSSFLTYFTAQPVAGWGDSNLALSFDYDFTVFGNDTLPVDDLTTPLADVLPVAQYGVFGWNDGELLPLELVPGPFTYPGTIVMGGMLPITTGPANIFDRVMADLTGFDFVGVAFAVGDLLGDPRDSTASLAIDNVLLTASPADVIPEPATMSLFVLALAASARRLRRRKSA